MRGKVRHFLLAGALVLVAASAAAQEGRGRSIVRLSYIPGNFALPVLVGIEHGMFAREGLSVSAVPVTDEGTIIRSLTAGATDFAIGSQSVLLSAAQNKLEGKVVAIASYGREVELLVPAWDTATNTLADIKGKTVLLISGVHNFDGVPELYRALALSKPPMRLSDVNFHFIALAQVQQLFDPAFRATYTQRKIAGIFMFREYAQRYVDEKKARVVVSNQDFTRLIGRLGAQPVFASKFVVEKEPKTVERFVRAWARTMQHMSEPQNKAAIVRVLQIYYLRQHGGVLAQPQAEFYVAAAKYDRVAWSEQDVAEVAINGKALSAARYLLFAAIKDPNQRPFKELPDLRSYIDTDFAKKALDDLEAEKKAAALKPAEPAKPEPAKPAQGTGTEKR
jgi:ABC-type nitrate/sulfonate/bicarbonate transport system substrate-binding protein